MGEYNNIAYVDYRFLRNLNSVDYICEVGSRYGDESIELLKYFQDSKILCFECNPKTRDICRENLRSHPNIKFFDIALGEKEELPFYSFNSSNPGASSFYKRIDYNDTQEMSGYINVKRLDTILSQENIPRLDLLCIDVQGFELNVLKGCGEFIEKISYIIIEEPKNTIGKLFLPKGMYSKYINSPTAEEIQDFLRNKGFIEIERFSENMIEDNVMYKNTRKFNI
jgi:FkbM family methyltransferase